MSLKNPTVRSLAAALLVSGTLLVSASVALAQRVGDTQFPQSADGGVRRFPAVAYDATNNAYLVAYGLSTVGARFVSADGAPLGSPVTVNQFGEPGAARVGCGGGFCLVAWVQEPTRPTSINARILRFSGGAVQFVTNQFTVSANGGSKLSSAGPAVAYSPLGGGEFLVSWTEFNPGIRITGQRVTTNGVLSGAEIPVATSLSFQGFPSATYNSALDEYVVAYHGESGALNIVTAQRVKPLTGVLLGKSSLYSGVFEQYPEIAYNSVDNQFLTITWHAGSGWLVHGQLADSSAEPFGAVLTLSTQSGGDGIGLAYNRTSNSYLAAFLNTQNDEIWGVIISNTGVPGAKFQLTSSGASAANFSTQPQVASSTRTNRWLTVASWGYKAVMSQVADSTGGGGGGGGGAITPAAPVLVGPGGNTSSATPTFAWAPAAGATAYQLWVNDSTGTKIQTWYNAAQAGCAAGTGTCIVTPSTSIAVGAGTWWVKGWNAEAGDGPWSLGMNFVRMTPAPGSATLVGPIGTIDTMAPTFAWAPVAGATHYLLWVRDSTGVRLQKWYQAAEVGCGAGTGTCLINPGITLAPGAGIWWIQTWNASGGYGAWSPGNGFWRNLSAPTLIGPSGALGGGSVQFSWSSVPGATHYHLWVNDSTGNRVAQWFQAAGVGCASGGTCSVTLSPTLSAGAGRWWVQSWSLDFGYSSWGTGLNFTR